MNSTLLKSILATAASLCTAGAGAFATTQPVYAGILAAGAALFVALEKVVSGGATDAKIDAAISGKTAP